MNFEDLPEIIKKSGQWIKGFWVVKAKDHLKGVSVKRHRCKDIKLEPYIQRSDKPS